MTKPTIEQDVHQDYSPELWSQITHRIESAKKVIPKPWVAAFDADGTLWNTDMGEIFFDYQIRRCELKGLPSDPWGQYEDTKKTNTTAAYLWLAQINNGIPLTQVQKWAEDAVVAMGSLPIFSSQKKLVSYLKEQEFEVFVVSASIKWAVEPAARRLGIDSNHVLAVKSKVVNGIVTLEQDGPMTWRDGKPKALLEATHGVRPIFCAGNTTGDTALLESATHGALAIKSANNTGELAETESALQKIAIERNWLRHTF